MSLSAEAPSEREIREQLQLILESELFATSAIQSNILRFIVEKTLAKSDITSELIRETIYRKTKTSEGAARQNIYLVRSRLADYYERFGAEDPVHIALLPGRGYKTTFRYNGDAKWVRLYRIGSLHQQAFTFASLKQAEHCFFPISGSSDSNVAAHLRVSEIMLQSALLHGLLGVDVTKAVGYVNDAKKYAARAIRKGVAYSKAGLLHNVAEILLCGHTDFNAYIKFVLSSAASQGREEGLITIGGQLGRNTPWGALYLSAWAAEEGNATTFESITRTLESRIHVDPTDFNIRLAALFFYYAVRRHDKADACIKEARVWQPYLNDAFHLICGLHYLEWDWFEDAWKEFAAISDDIYTFQSENGTAAVKSIVRVPGFRTLTLARWQGVEKGREYFLSVLKEQRQRYSAEIETHAEIRLPPFGPRSFQMAVAYTALGQIGRALSCLRRAKRERDPLLPWLSFMPFFEPLRSHSRWDEIFPKPKVAVFYINGAPEEE